MLKLCPAAVSKEMPTVLTNAEPLVNTKLSAPSNAFGPVISLPLMTPVMVSMAQTPVLSVGDAVIVPLPGRGSPPRSGAGPVSDQSKTLALAGSDAGASGSIPAIIMGAKVLANFINCLSAITTDPVDQRPPRSISE